jgi:hypothetical protein
MVKDRTGQEGRGLNWTGQGGRGLNWTGQGGRGLNWTGQHLSFQNNSAIFYSALLYIILHYTTILYFTSLSFTSLSFSVPSPPLLSYSLFLLTLLSTMLSLPFLCNFSSSILALA